MSCFEGDRGEVSSAQNKKRFGGEDLALAVGSGNARRDREVHLVFVVLAVVCIVSRFSWSWFSSFHNGFGH